MSNMQCPLCFSTIIEGFFSHRLKISALEQNRDYFQCQNCRLIFQDPQQFLSESEEKKRYLTHENEEMEPGYIQFLQKILDPLELHIESTDRGLDFGCGPYPAVQQLMSLKGRQIDSFDPIFFNKVLTGPYDFILCNEVIEHFYKPQAEFKTLKSLLKEGGKLAIQTGQLEDWRQFPDWHYHRDPTHVCFYPPQCFDWICKEFEFSKLFVEKDRYILCSKENNTFST